MLDKAIIEQLNSIFKNLSANYTLEAKIGKNHDEAQNTKAFLSDFTSSSDRLAFSFKETEDNDLTFLLLKEGKETGIAFKGIPNGHEFTSLILAVLNADGQGKNFPDEQIARRIAAIPGKNHFKTYVSLTCTNCPDIVQTLNLMALLNPGISHEMVDGALFQDEVSRLGIQSVPAVYLNGDLFHVGRGTLGELLLKLEERTGTTGHEAIVRNYDVIVLGGGPAGSAAAIYSARKGLNVAVVAERIGGQVNETVGIENLISVPQTTGRALAENLKSHMGNYPIDLFENRKISEVELDGQLKEIHAQGGEIFQAPALIIATGASWRRLNVDGEAQYLGQGVHFCPHCDGPFYRDKRVAVIGGGNSGMEAAIDLSGICQHVTVLEFADELRADAVLQEKAAMTPNIEIFKSHQTTQVVGDNAHLTAIRVKDRMTGEEREIPLDGIFVQIGLAPNSGLFRDKLPLNDRGEIIVDVAGRTSMPGVYAAGDVTSTPYKQIIISMGEGAKAALSAFEDKIRNVI